jgi:hypothetical protein
LSCTLFPSSPLLSTLTPLPQNKLNEAEDKLLSQARDAQTQIDAANRDRDAAVDALNTAQRQLNDVNNRMLELAAGSGPGQAHPVTGEVLELSVGVAQGPTDRLTDCAPPSLA